MAAGSTGHPEDAARAPAAQVAARLGLAAGAIVQELGYDEDTDAGLIEAVEAQIGGEVIGADSDEIVDVVLLWFRADDGDLVDALVDAIGPLSGSGIIWLLTPKRGRDGYVDPADIAEAAPVAGLSLTSQMSVADGWTGARLVPPKGRSEKR